MKVSSKRSPWVYAVLLLMLGALILFSVGPLLSSLWSSGTKSPDAVNPQVERLASQALGYQLVIEREPENVNAWEGLLETRLQQGDLTAAIAPLERLAQLKPQKLEYTLLLAQTKEQIKDYEGAANLYRGMLQQYPWDVHILKGLTDLFLGQNRPTEAVNTVQNAIDQVLKAKTANPEENLNSQLIALQLLLAEVHLQQKQDDTAIALYDAISLANPTDFRPVLAKALVLQKQGQTDTAAPLFQQALTLAPVQYKDTIKKMSLGKQP